MPLDLIEFPADDLSRARRFWETLLDLSLEERTEGEGQGLQTHEAHPSLGLHQRGRGPGDRFSLPYFQVPDLARALERLVELGGSLVHPGERWAICRDSEGSPFGLTAESPPDELYFRPTDERRSSDDGDHLQALRRRQLGMQPLRRVEACQRF
jgi:predicted enzyme related to lactoylglutathione lyase